MAITNQWLWDITYQGQWNIITHQGQLGITYQGYRYITYRGPGYNIPGRVGYNISGTVGYNTPGILRYHLPGTAWHNDTGLVWPYHRYSTLHVTFSVTGRGTHKNLPLPRPQHYMEIKERPGKHSNQSKQLSFLLMHRSVVLDMWFKSNIEGLQELSSNYRGILPLNKAATVTMSQAHHPCGQHILCAPTTIQGSTYQCRLWSNNKNTYPLRPTYG